MTDVQQRELRFLWKNHRAQVRILGKAWRETEKALADVMRSLVARDDKAAPEKLQSAGAVKRHAEWSAWLSDVDAERYRQSAVSADMRRRVDQANAAWWGEVVRVLGADVKVDACDAGYVVDGVLFEFGDEK